MNTMSQWHVAYTDSAVIVCCWDGRPPTCLRQPYGRQQGCPQSLSTDLSVSFLVVHLCIQVTCNSRGRNVWLRRSSEWMTAETFWVMQRGRWVPKWYRSRILPPFLSPRKGWDTVFWYTSARLYDVMPEISCGSVRGIATRLRAGWTGVRIPV